ncbi:TNF receptor-associated factor 6 [Habropoda laboriosa]|uniref:TNF receptor-associated factor 6 n=1 Tax=Habropoda laboriosa TaxID=597456 RepID=A0A0L7REJ8_9HYME|nr:TNF receptor-associated factor 6 [Habropoda laboriosa]
MAKSDNVKDHVKIAEENILCGDGMKEYLEPRFECPICLTWLHDPVLTSCGHKFCSQCIYTWLQKEGACCPIDSKPLKSEGDLFRDLYTSREISQQRMPCPYQQFGCEVKLSPVDMEAHINQCIHNGSLSSSRNLVLKALPQLSISRNQTNAITAESKLWDPPPKNASLEKNEPSLEWQQLLKNLYERIVILEQQNRELSIAVSNQKTQLTTLQTSLQFNQDEMFLRSCNGVYIWRLQSFHEKLESMMNDSLKMFYSPGFYTSPNGYKICARINVSSKDPEYLSLLLHIMKSENDDGLDWPFNGTMYFILVHPHDWKKDIREITSSRPDLEAFRKPVCELNKRSFGYTELVRIQDLPDFLQNDCLIFRIEVRVYDRFSSQI